VKGIEIEKRIFWKIFGASFFGRLIIQKSIAGKQLPKRKSSLV
jgi:hypothetical protein